MLSMSVLNLATFASLFLLCYSDSVIRYGEDVERMRIIETVGMIKSGNRTFSPVVTKLKAGSFSWKNCGSSSDLLVVNDLSVTPDPVKTPGILSLKFDINIQETFEAPLQLSLDVKKHEKFFWLHIPCIEGMGSCTYNNICQKLATLTCPKPFADNKIPCKCPFTQGHYSLPTSSFTVGVNIPKGEYLVESKLSYGSKAVNCIQMHFNIS